MKVGSFDTDRDVLVVAEIGNNHEGHFEWAAEMVRQAARCGVGAVKFQTVRAAQLVRRAETARFERLTRFELSDSQFAALSELAHELGLLFLSTPLSLQTAAFLEPMLDAFKIASGDNDFFPLLEKVARTAKPVIVSTGVSDVSQIDAMVQFLRGQWQAIGIQGELALLHCVSSYPTPPEQGNLQSIPFLADRFGCTVGYSDHTLGTETAVLAVAAGARIIEKHFTLDKNQSDFRDHQLSADPAEMARLVERVRETELLLGTWGKSVQPSEAAAQSAIRRSIVAARDLKCGTAIRAGDLKWIRPGDGMRPGDEAKLIGRRLKRDLCEDDMISLGDVE
jgi:N,N'-diacetyllegionaminate synthase